MARKSNKRIEKVFGKDIVVNEQYYLNNRALPTIHSEYEWTPEMIAALNRSKEDVHYFAETFFTIINGDRKRECIKLHPYQNKTLEMMDKNNRVLFLFRTSAGQNNVNDYLCALACKLS